MATTVATRPKVVLGTMTFGKGGRVSDIDEVRRILGVFREYGHDELDTARMYCDGNTEVYLGEIGVQREQPAFKLATKAYPFKAGDHEPEKLKAQFNASLAALKTDKVDIFYLHAPDHATDINLTLRAVQDLYEAGHFTELGLSNYAAWQVAEIYYICKYNKYIMPTLYQGMYNSLTRDVERELLPALRKFNIRFYMYNPLAGGLLTDRYAQAKLDDIPKEGRFSGSTDQGVRYRNRYWNDAYLDALSRVKAACDPHSISINAAALRWCAHHSQLKSSFGDAIVIGASSLEQLKQNLDDLNAGPLPADVALAFDEAWTIVQSKAACQNYFR